MHLWAFCSFEIYEPLFSCLQEGSNALFSCLQEGSNAMLLTCNDNFSARSANGAMRDLHPCCKFDQVLHPPVAHSVTGLDSSASVLYKRN